MLSAIVEMRDEHCNGMAQVFKFLAVSDGAASKASRERADAQIRAFSVASGGHRKVRIANARLTLYYDDHKRIKIAGHHLIRAAKNFGFRGVVNFVSEYLFHGGIPTAISRKSIRRKLKPLWHTPLQIAHEDQRVFLVPLGRVPVEV